MSCCPKVSSLEGDEVQLGMQDRGDFLRSRQRCRSMKSIQRLVVDMAGLLVVQMWAWVAKGEKRASLEIPGFRAGQGFQGNCCLLV